jgi:hypothetical protein
VDHATGHVIADIIEMVIAVEALMVTIITTTGILAHGAHVLTRTQTLLVHVIARSNVAPPVDRQSLTTTVPRADLLQTFLAKNETSKNLLLSGGFFVAMKRLFRFANKLFFIYCTRLSE